MHPNRPHSQEKKERKFDQLARLRGETQIHVFCIYRLRFYFKNHFPFIFINMSTVTEMFYNLMSFLYYTYRAFLNKLITLAYN